MHISYYEISKKIKRLLIANRGEAAMRAIRTCKDFGIESAVIYHGKDEFSDWVFAADFAYEIYRHDENTESPYLDGKQIVEVALKHNCNAVWPGWGFLSENAEFAEQVMAAELIWVGPHPNAMRLLGSKSESYGVARDAGFDTIEQIHINNTENPDQIRALGFPIIIKPTFGGGGQGQKIITADDDLASAIDDSIRQAETLFRDGSLVAQKYFPNAKHIELQAVGDMFGNVCILGTRDCSIQRRNQKIIEEGPVPNIDPESLKRATEAAINLFRNCGYYSAGTIETLFSGGKFYFLECSMQDRRSSIPLLKKSAVIRGDGHKGKTDISAEMLSIATGNALTFKQEDVETVGYAIEARLYAEDPDRGFLPTPGSDELHKISQDAWGFVSMQESLATGE